MQLRGKACAGCRTASLRRKPGGNPADNAAPDPCFQSCGLQRAVLVENLVLLQSRLLAALSKPRSWIAGHRYPPFNRSNVTACDSQKPGWRVDRRWRESDGEEC